MITVKIEIERDEEVDVQLDCFTTLEPAEQQRIVHDIAKALTQYLPK